MKTLKCRPVLVEVDKSFLYLHGGKLYNNRTTMHIPDGKQITQQLILISLNTDEKIEVGNKYYSTIHNQIFECINNKQYFENEFKVIATQSQLSPEYIQQFIEEYNKDEVKDVEIEMEFINIHTNLELKEFSNSKDKCYNSPLNVEMYLKDESHNYVLGHLTQRYLNGAGHFQIKNSKPNDMLYGGRGCALKHLFYLKPKLTNGFITIVNEEQQTDHSLDGIDDLDDYCWYAGCIIK